MMKLVIGITIGHHMINIGNVEVIAVSRYTIKVDGEMFYFCEEGWRQPYVCFDIMKIEFHHGSKINWDEKYKMVSIPINIVKNPEKIYITTYYNGTFLLEKDKRFVKKLHGKYVGGSTRGPSSAPDAFSITSNSKMPKVINCGNFYHYYDRESYDRFS